MNRAGIRGTKDKKAIDLRSMSIDDLLVLRDHISETLSSRVKTERRELESRLARLQSVKVAEPDQYSSRSRGAGLKGKKVPPKYRNPDNSTETWAGRGRQPRWMTAAIKAGKKMSDFKIADAATANSRGRGSRRSRSK